MVLTFQSVARGRCFFSKWFSSHRNYLIQGSHLPAWTWDMVLPSTSLDFCLLALPVCSLCLSWGLIFYPNSDHHLSTQQHPVSQLYCLNFSSRDSPAPHAFIEHQQCTRHVLGPGRKKKIKVSLLRNSVLKEERKWGSSESGKALAKEVTWNLVLREWIITQKGFPRKRNCKERWKGIWLDLREILILKLALDGLRVGEPGGVGRRQATAARPPRGGPALPSRQPRFRLGCLMPLVLSPPRPSLPCSPIRNMPFPQIFLSSKMQLLCHLL